MPPVDEETANLRAELGKLAEKIREKQEAVRDDTSLGTPGAKYTIFLMQEILLFFSSNAWKSINKEITEGSHQQSDLLPLQWRQQVF